MAGSDFGSPHVARGNWSDRILRLDWGLLLTTIFIVFIGLLMIHSIEGGKTTGFVDRQLWASCIGLGGLLFLMILPYQVFRFYGRPLYVFMLLFLVAVLFIGVNLRGTKGWFPVGPIYIQASEIAKLTFVLTMAAYLDRRISWHTPGSLLLPFILAMIPIGLILLQPDLSSSLVFFPAIMAMFFVAGARTLHLLAICLVGGVAVGVPLASTYFGLLGSSLEGRPIMNFFSQAFAGGIKSVWLFFGISFFLFGSWWFLRKLRVYVPSVYLWVTLFLLGLGTMGAVGFEHALKDYQRKRLVAFINPDIDPLDSGYNVRQSQIAIGSGRVLGKGYRNGTQSKLGFLPSQHTDFIFSVVGEELGFIRSLFILGLYFLIVWRGFEISLVARDRFGSLVAAGFSAMFAFYFLLNLGMTMGMAPVAGVPLPMVSYGGSSVVSSMLAIGILMSIHWRRYYI